MSKETPPLFGKTKLLEGQIDEFLDKVAEGAIYFERGITAYIQRVEGGEVPENCKEKLSQIVALKEKCKELRRSIVNTLYSEMLIPDFRGDVLRLLTNLFSLLDDMGKNFQDLMIEQSHTYKVDDQVSTQEFLELVKVVVKSVDIVVVAARTFFRDPKSVRDHIYQVRVYESEADKIAISLKKKIFDTELKFSEKINLGAIVNAIDAIADKAEDVADELAIYAIQRTL